MTRMQCIEYLVKNAVRSNEWAEASMFSAVCEVMAEEDATFGPGGKGDTERLAWLDELLSFARDSY